MLSSMLKLSTMLDFLRAFDPGYSKLRNAFRSTLAVVASYFAASYLAGAFHASRSLPFLAGLMAMMGSLAIVDLRKAEEKLATLLIIPPATLVIVLSILFSESAMIRIVIFLGVAFAAVAVRRFGPRWSGLGLTTFMAYFASLFFPFHMSDLPYAFLSLVIGCGFVYVARFWLLPDHSENMLRHYVSAFQAQVRKTLSTMAGCLEKPLSENDRRPTHELPKQWLPARKAFIRLNETGLTVEQFVDLSDSSRLRSSSAAFQLDLFEREFDLRRLWDASVRLLLAQPENQALHQAIGRDLEAFIPLIGRARVDLPPTELLAWPLGDEVWQARLDDYKKARQSFADRLKIPLQQTTGMEEVLTRIDEKGLAVPAVQKEGFLHISTRQAIQATVATALASLIGNYLSPQRWYWASIAAFLVFIGASRGETLLRAILRIAGTVLGLLFGFGLSFVARESSALEWALVIVCVFCGIYGSRLSFGFWSASLFSSMFVLLYDRLGQLSRDILYLRVEETLIGAVLGALVAAIVLPTSTHAVIRSAVAKFLRTIARVIAELQVDVPSRFSRRSLVRVLREMDRDLASLRLSAAPITEHGSLMKRGTVPGLVHDATALAHFVKHLAVHVKVDGEESRAAFAQVCQNLIQDFLGKADEIESGQKPGNYFDDAETLARLDRDARYYIERLRIVALSLKNRSTGESPSTHNASHRMDS